MNLFYLRSNFEIVKLSLQDIASDSDRNRIFTFKDTRARMKTVPYYTNETTI